MSTLRSQMIRTASVLPVGDPTRRKLLAALATGKKASSTPDFVRWTQSPEFSGAKGPGVEMGWTETFSLPNGTDPLRWTQVLEYRRESLIKRALKLGDTAARAIPYRVSTPYFLSVQHISGEQYMAAAGVFMRGLESEESGDLDWALGRIENAVGVRVRRASDKQAGNLSFKGNTALGSTREAGSDAVLWQIIDQRGFYKLYNEMEDANDESSASMLREISDKLAKSLELSGNEQQALSRLRRCVDAQGKWDPALQRNNIFKAANLLGIKLPHGMF